MISHQCCLYIFKKLIKTNEFTVGNARQVAVLRWTTLPNLDLLFTIQYGTPILRHKAGRNNTI